MNHEENRESRLNSLDVSRGIAALMVVLYHANFLCSAARMKPFDSFFAFGDSGVDFFFVLSGFIMTWIHRKDWGKPKRLPNYLWRRFVRIYPTYWVATLLCATPLVLIPWVRSPDLSSPWGFVLSNIFLTPSTHYMIIPPAWTLQHEVLFYSIFSLFMLNRSMAVIFIVLWATAISLACLIVGAMDFPLKFLLNPVNVEFPIGMLCAFMVKRLDYGKAVILLAVGCLLFFGSAIGHVRAHWFAIGSFGYPLNLVLAKGIGAGLIIMGMVTIERTITYEPHRPLILLGSASYSIYLIHLPSMVLLLLVLIASGLLEILTAGTVFALLAGYGTVTGIAFHYVSEKPLLNWLRRSYRPVFSNRSHGNCQ